MIDEQLRKVQLVQLRIAKEIKRICEKNNIKYILIGGTLLGAVRHKGFIPWDDDLDIGFERSEYERFLSVAQKELGDEFCLQEWETDKDYAYPFGKVRMNNTLFDESSVTNKKSHLGIFVDIFPYDSYPAERKKRKLLKIRLTLLRQIICLKTKYCEYISFSGNTARQWAKIILYPILKITALCSTKQMLIKRFNKIAQAANGIGTEMLYEHSGASQYGKWLISRECFTDTQNIAFEDAEFSIPKAYDAYLTNGYGDYMTPPPIDKRTNRHGVTRISLDCSEVK